jgi:osmotically-inducible protein OsmY
MTAPFRLMPIFFGIALMLQACDSERSAPASKSAGPSGAAVTQGSDSELENTIRAKLESDNAVKQANLSVTADADEKKATLSGTVESQEVRSKAIELAQSAQPGLTIEDKIDVRPAG